MKNLANIFKLLFIMLCLNTNDAISNEVISSETITVKQITVPFGIRYYDIGAAPNFTLNDIDGEKFELNSSKGSFPKFKSNFYYDSFRSKFNKLLRWNGGAYLLRTGRAGA